jgi:phage-related protein
MEGEVIKSFLVGLGFSVDESSLARFNKSIAGAALKITALYTSIQVAAAGIFHSIAGISEGFEEMGYSLRLVAPAVNKFLLLRQAMLSTYQKAGINIVKVVQDSIKFNFSLAKTKIALEAIYKSVGAKFLPLLTKQMDVFRAKIFQNMPKIQAQLTKLVEFIFKAFSATVELGTRLWSILGRVWDFFVKLDEATGGWSTKILAVIAAWKLLNLEFLATPLGMILGGLFAILALYDDFEVWKEGGKSFFNWGPVVPIINQVSEVFHDLYEGLSDIFAILFDLVGAFSRLIHLDWAGFTNNIGNAFGDVKKYLEDVYKYAKDLFTLISGGITGIASVAGYVGNLFGGNAGPAQAPGGINQPNPLLPPGTGGVNQRVNQETNILVQGSADAHAVGKAVASQQDKVNFDMTRNLKGALQ